MVNMPIHPKCRPNRLAKLSTPQQERSKLVYLVADGVMMADRMTARRTDLPYLLSEQGIRRRHTWYLNVS